MSQEAAEALEYRYHFHLLSGARVSSDFIEVENDPYHSAGETVKEVAHSISRWAKGEDGVFMFPVNESLTYVPFRSIEFASLEYVVAGERQESQFAVSDESYMFEGK